MTRVLAAFLFWLATVASEARADYHSRVTANNCHPAPAAAWAGRTGNWRTWTNYIALCPVRAEDGRTVLFVLTPRIDAWEDDLGQAEPPGPIPRAEILDLDLHELGTLTTPLGKGRPSRTILEFSDWRNGIPWRIDAHQINPIPRVDYDEYPAIWNPARRRYEIDETQ